MDMGTVAVGLRPRWAPQPGKRSRPLGRWRGRASSRSTSRLSRRSRDERPVGPEDAGFGPADCGHFAGKTLADFGTDVIKIKPVGGGASLYTNEDPVQPSPNTRANSGTQAPADVRATPCSIVASTADATAS